ncbi:MAG: NADH-quinone oxidoreductase subunit C [Candidatus Saliniplasma sp.]
MKEIQLPLELDEMKDHLEEELGDGIEEISTEEIEKGLKSPPMKLIWLKVERDKFRDAVKTISELQVPHLSVTSGSDKGDVIELIYHFAVNYGYPGEEVIVNLKVHLPKDDPTIPTITDLVPGAITTEREKQEFLGIEVKDIPDSRRLWLDEVFPEDKYPWRWDDKGVEDQSRYVHDEKEAFVPPTAEKPREGGEEDE